MTYTEEFIPEEEQGFEEEQEYPTAFGITLTPQVQGIGLGLLGLVGAAYIIMTFVMPSWQEYQTLREDATSKRQQVEQQEQGNLAQQYQTLQAELQQAQVTRKRVLQFFSNEQTLDTILIDVNRFIKARNLELLSFQPSGGITVVNDSSLGAAVNQKLQRQSYQLSVEGSFEETQALLRDLERLQPLLLIKNLTSEITQEETAGTVVVVSDQKATILPEDNLNLNTSFTLDVILPANVQPPKPAAEPPAEGEQPPAEEQPAQ